LETNVFSSRTCGDVVTNVECGDCYDNFQETIFYGSNSTNTYDFTVTAEVQNLPDQIASASLFYQAPCQVVLNYLEIDDFTHGNADDSTGSAINFSLDAQTYGDCRGVNATSDLYFYSNSTGEVIDHWE